MTKTEPKETARKIAASQLTIGEYLLEKAPIGGGASVPRHHEWEGGDGGKVVTTSSMMDGTITWPISSEKPLEGSDVSTGIRHVAGGIRSPLY